MEKVQTGMGGLIRAAAYLNLMRILFLNPPSTTTTTPVPTLPICQQTMLFLRREASRQ